MSNSSEKGKINFTDLDPGDELNKQLAAVRKKDRVVILMAGIAVGLLLTLGVGYYVADARANLANAGTASGYNSGTAQYASTTNSPGTAIGGGSCCGGGIGGIGIGEGGGGCGAAGTSLGSVPPADLEQQALVQYAKETGAKDVTAKAKDFGCHIQVDISDKTGKVVRSYGFQGGPLYVIK